MIAIYLPSLGAGGAEKVMVHLANGLADEGYDVELVLGRSGGDYADLVDEDVAVRDLDVRRAPLAPSVGSIPSLYAYFRDNDPDAIVSSIHHVNVFVLLAHRLASSSATTIVSLHGDPVRLSETSTRSALVFRVADHVYRWADHVVAVSEGVAESFCTTTSFEPESVDVVYNPVVTSDLLERSREEPDHPWFDEPEPVLLNVGRFSDQKNQACLLRAFERLCDDRDAKLLLVGRGEREAELAELADDLGVADHLDVVNWTENPYAMMRAADAFVLSSIWEGLPTVLIEALACECPIVSTDCPSGPAEILADGEYGELVEPDDPAALEAGIRRELDDPTPGEALRERAESFTASSAVAAYGSMLPGT